MVAESPGNWCNLRQFLGNTEQRFRMNTTDFFRARQDQMIDLRHPLAVLARRIPWDRIEEQLSPFFAHKNRPGISKEVSSLFVPSVQIAGGGVSNADRPRLPTFTTTEVIAHDVTQVHSLLHGE